MSLVVNVMCVLHSVMLAVELASKEVQHELDEIQRQLNELLTAEENAMKERIRYDTSCQLFNCHIDTETDKCTDILHV